MHNVVSVQVGQCLESAPEDVFGVVHHQLQHSGLLLVLHQEVGEGTVAHLGQVALQVATHAGHEVVAEVAGGTLGVLLTHHHCLEGEDVVMGQQSKDLHLHLAEVSLQGTVTGHCNQPAAWDLQAPNTVIMRINQMNIFTYHAHMERRCQHIQRYRM